jgi:hypothetical protein
VNETSTPELDGIGRLLKHVGGIITKARDMSRDMPNLRPELARVEESARQLFANLTCAAARIKESQETSDTDGEYSPATGVILTEDGLARLQPNRLDNES